MGIQGNESSFFIHVVLFYGYKFLNMGIQGNESSFFAWKLKVCPKLVQNTLLTLTWNTKNIIYLITCKNCSKQYIGSATSFKERFWIHKSDINTGKFRCGVANHLLNVCKSAICKTEYLQVQLIEQVFARKGEDIDKILWEREKYWQAQLFTLTHGLNSISEWYAINRRGYRK